jgi:outer membrane protein
MEESFRYVQQKFDVGVLNATDYVVAKTNLFRAQSEMYQAKYQYLFQLKILDFYKGVPISI